MIRLHLLGAARIEGSGVGKRRSVLSQPRRAALLAYLALRAPHGAERRDTLLGVFWPESDAGRARGALRNALHFLRMSLRPELIRSLGSEEVELDLSLLWCDAIEFERRCDAGDPSAALRLYSGDLLEGFFISGAPEFEHWLEAERSRLRQRAIDAARALVAQAEAAGAAGLAALHLRRLLELAPTDEATARHLMTLLAAADERGEALRVYIDLQARFEHEYGLEPADETRRLAEAIRVAAVDLAARARDDAPAAANEIPAPAPDPPRPEREPADDAAAAAQALAAGDRTNGSTLVASSRSWLRGRRTLTAAAATFTVALAAAALVLAASREDPPAPSPALVAVLPFEYRGATEHAYLADGVADLLAANLDGAGELRSVDRRALLAERSLEQPVPREIAGRTVATLGAGLYVLGAVTEASGQLRITAALYSSDDRSTPRSKEIVVEGSAAEVLVLADRLAVGLLEGHEPSPLGRAALRSATSLEALKSFLRGEAALRRRDVQSALDHYRRATQLEASFALAHYRLSSVAYWRGISQIPIRWAGEALRHAGSLAREDSLLVAAWHHQLAGSLVEARQFYEEAIWLRPDHAEAHHQLGELLFHWGSSLGVPASEARERFRRVLAAEPHNVDAALHLVRLAARDGRLAELDSLATRMQRADPGGSWTVEVEALRAFLSADAGRQSRAIEAAGSVGGRDAAILESMAAHSHNLAAVERVARERLTLGREPAEQARLQLLLVHVRLGQGRFRDADAALAEATALPGPRRLEYRAMTASLPFRPKTPGELHAVRDDLAAHPDDGHEVAGPLPGRGIEYPELLWPGMYRPRRQYLLGALHERLGSYADLAAVADTLAREAARPGPGRPFAVYYERITRARAAAAAGRHAAALDTLGPAPPAHPGHTFETLVDHGRVYERWLRAELLRESGQLAEALRWYGTFPDPMARDLAYLAPSHLQRAEIFDAGGGSEQAAFHYTRFIDLWADADPPLQPQVARARERLHEIAR